MLLVPVTLAENCSVDPAVIVALVGEIVIVCAESLILQEACALAVTALVAVTVAVVAELTLAGAV